MGIIQLYTLPVGTCMCFLMTVGAPLFMWNNRWVNWGVYVLHLGVWLWHTNT